MFVFLCIFGRKVRQVRFMENVNQRVFRLLGNKHGVQKDLADFLGISDRNVNMWKKRGTGIDSEYIPGIADYLCATDTYLLRGEDESFTSEELKLIGPFRSLSEQGKSEVMNFIQYTFQFDNEDIRKQLLNCDKYKDCFAPCQKPLFIRSRRRKRKSGIKYRQDKNIRSMA